jgi:hypothetical protein
MPLDDTASENLPDIITLKLKGKAFSCPFRTGKLRCGEKLFHPCLSGADAIDKYTCTRCGSTYVDAINDFEPQLPPRNDWRTPGGSAMEPVENGLWTTLHLEYAFNIDAASDANNRKCWQYFDGLTPATDGLLCDWFGDNLPAELARVFWNCPYNPKGAVEAWLKQALAQAQKGVFSVGLIPMASSVAWFNDLVIPFAQWHTFRGRIPFEDPFAAVDAEGKPIQRTSPKQDNLLVIFDPYAPDSSAGHAAVRCSKTGQRLWTRT